MREKFGVEGRWIRTELRKGEMERVEGRCGETGGERNKGVGESIG